MGQYELYSMTAPLTSSPMTSYAETPVMTGAKLTSNNNNPVAAFTRQLPPVAPLAAAGSGVEAFSAQWRRRADSKRQRCDTSTFTTMLTADAAVHPVRSTAAGIVTTTAAAAASTAKSVKSNDSRGKTRKLTDDEKIEKHRMIVRRSYYQKKALKAQLRREIAQLEHQYSAIMQRTDAQTAASSGLSSFSSSHSLHSPVNNNDAGAAMRMSELLVCTCCTSIPCVRTLYRALSIEKERLREQNDALDKQLLQHLVFHDKVAFVALQQLTEGLAVYSTTTSTAASSSSSSSSSTHRRKRTNAAASATCTHISVVMRDNCALSFAPLQSDECNATSDAALRNFVLKPPEDALNASDAFDTSPSSTTLSRPLLRSVGRSILGWSRCRSFGVQQPTFLLHKRFADVPSAALLASRVYDAYTLDTAATCARVYSSAINLYMEHVQRVDDDHALFYRTLQSVKQHQTTVTQFKTFFQLSRIVKHEEQRILLLFCSIEPSRILPDVTDDLNNKPFEWLDMCSWLSFTDVLADANDADDKGARSFCDIEFGGNVPSPMLGDAAFWMMEMLSYVLRLENAFMQPVFRVDDS